MCAAIERISTSKGYFRDGQDRQRLFNGLNMVCKSAGSGYVYPLSLDDYRQLSHSGINILRFGVFWAAVEPEPGVFDGAYLQRVKEQLEYAHKAGLSFFHRPLRRFLRPGRAVLGGRRAGLGRSDGRSAPCHRGSMERRLPYQSGPKPSFRTFLEQ